MLDLVALGKTFEDLAGEKQSSVEKGTGRGCVSSKEIGDLCVFQIVCPFGRCLFFVKTNWRKETKDKESKIVVHTPSPLTICVKTAARRRALVSVGVLAIGLATIHLPLTIDQSNTIRVSP